MGKKCAGAQCEDDTASDAGVDSGFKSDAARTFKAWFTPVLVNMQITCSQVCMAVSVFVVETVIARVLHNFSLNATSNVRTASIFVLTARQIPQPPIRNRSNYRLGHLREIQITPTSKQHLTPCFDICIISPWRRIDITPAICLCRAGGARRCQL